MKGVVDIAKYIYILSTLLGTSYLGTYRLYYDIIDCWS